jgi:ubiquitin-conjugating enzyme E2 W
MRNTAQRRLTRELEDLNQNRHNIFQVDLRREDLMLWHVTFNGASDSLYSGETFTLQFKFDSGYPIESPEVTFINVPPVHEHIYSNGYICLSILYSGWTASMRVESVVLSIISMLSSATEKKKPPNDEGFAESVRNRSPKSLNWIFDDDKA